MKEFKQLLAQAHQESEDQNTPTVTRARTEGAQPRRAAVKTLADGTTNQGETHRHEATANESNFTDQDANSSGRTISTSQPTAASSTRPPVFLNLESGNIHERPPISVNGSLANQPAHTPTPVLAALGAELPSENSGKRKHSEISDDEPQGDVQREQQDQEYAPLVPFDHRVTLPISATVAGPLSRDVVPRSRSPSKRVRRVLDTSSTRDCIPDEFIQHGFASIAEVCNGFMSQINGMRAEKLAQIDGLEAEIEDQKEELQTLQSQIENNEKKYSRLRDENSRLSSALEDEKLKNTELGRRFDWVGKQLAINLEAIHALSSRLEETHNQTATRIRGSEEAIQTSIRVASDANASSTEALKQAVSKIETEYICKIDQCELIPCRNFTMLSRHVS